METWDVLTQLDHHSKAVCDTTLKTETRLETENGSLDAALIFHIQSRINKTKQGHPLL